MIFLNVISAKLAWQDDEKWPIKAVENSHGSRETMGLPLVSIDSTHQLTIMSFIWMNGLWKHQADIWRPAVVFISVNGIELQSLWLGMGEPCPAVPLFFPHHQHAEVRFSRVAYAVHHGRRALHDGHRNSWISLDGHKKYRTTKCKA